MGLLAAPSAHAGPPQLPARSGRGSHVAILGAGVAGMTHMSYINGWQEGAVRSAHYTVAQIAERVRAKSAT